MVNKISIDRPSFLNSIGSTLPDVNGISASLISSSTGQGNQNLILKGVEAGLGITLNLIPVNTGNVPETNDKKIVIGLSSNQPSNSPFVRKIGDQMTGNLTFSNSSGARILAGENNVTQPSYSFLSDQDTGVFRPINDTLSLVTGGVERVRVRFDGNVVVTGSGQFSLPTGTTAQRPTINVNGSIRHNTDSGFIESRVKNSWRNIVTPANVPLNGQFISWNGSDPVWANVSSALVTIVSTIADRNSLTPSLGQLVWVETANDGEWALYLCTQVSPITWTEIANYDSSITDAKTRTVLFDYTASSPYLISNVSNNSRVSWVVVEVITPFNDASSVFYVGDQFVNNRLFDTSSVDLQTVGVYISNPTYVYTGLTQDEPIRCYFNFGTSTTGLIKTTISWQ